MKNILKITLFSVLLTTSLVHSSKQLAEEAPEMAASTMKCVPKGNRAAELELLNKGQVAFLEGKFSQALSNFQKALGDYGSPLGYLYASCLEKDDQTANRYLFTAQNAVKHDALSQKIFNKHDKWIESFCAAQTKPLNPKDF